MKRNRSVLLSAVLLFVFSFSLIVTIHSTALADPPNYNCCQYPVCGEVPPLFSYGVWYDGVCTHYPPANPNNCPTAQTPCP